MIVREENGRYILIEQHEHALASGQFARYWADKPSPLEPTLYAIANHDLGWRELDREMLWNEETRKPYSFVDYPIEPKLQGYRRGLDAVQEKSPYAALLCSMHYSSFVQRSTGQAEVRFREEESRRQEKVRADLSREELENVEYNFRLLQLCDDFSLFVCLNEPGHNDHPWYRDGFRFLGKKLTPIWEDRHTLRIEPDPFSGSFRLSIPYRLMEKGGKPAGDGRLELQVVG